MCHIDARYANRMRLLAQGEGDVQSPGLRSQVLASACGYGNVLPAVDLVGNRRCVGSKGQRGLPQQFPSCLVEGAKLLVVVGGADEQQSAGGDNRPAIIFATGALHTSSSEFGVLAKGNLPRIFPGIQVD